jgi:hypothetical protein
MHTRTFQSHALKQLVDWAAKSIDKSINQPILPHLIIVVNASDTNIDDALWDTEKATQHLLGDYAQSIQEVEELRKHRAQLEAELNITITSTEALLYYFYSSVAVVRIPNKSRLMQIDNQVGKLHDLIISKCAQSYASKKKDRMLLNAEKLPQYVNAAYDHFSRDITKAFNFAGEALRQTPLPQGLSDHILNLMLSLYVDHGQATKNADALLDRLSLPIASCFMLAATRDKLQGQSSSIEHYLSIDPYCAGDMRYFLSTSKLTHYGAISTGAFTDLLMSTYHDPLYKAYDSFCSQWLRCDYKKSGFECCNTPASHQKGHQADNGKILSRNGRYQDPFDTGTFFSYWIDRIRNDINSQNQRLEHGHGEYKERIFKLHTPIMANLYKSLSPTKLFKSHSTCLCCVKKVPEHILPCGHILCKDCVRAYGRNMGETGTVELDCCPLHPQPPFHSTARIQFKPREAGVRCLSLEGYVFSWFILYVLFAIEYLQDPTFGVEGKKG